MVLQSCPEFSVAMHVRLVVSRFYYPMGRNPAGSSVHGILQARILENFFLQGIFPTQGWNPHLPQLLPWQENSLPLSYLGSPNG